MTNKSLILLRFVWVALFAWFGTEQLLHPEAWAVNLPEWTGYLPIPAEALVQLNGWIEIVLATALLIGVHTRLVAVLLSFHLLSIAIEMGGAIGMRDMTLALMGLAIALNPPDDWTLDAKFKKK